MAITMQYLFLELPSFIISVIVFILIRVLILDHRFLQLRIKFQLSSEPTTGGRVKTCTHHFQKLVTLVQMGHYHTLSLGDRPVGCMELPVNS